MSDKQPPASAPNPDADRQGDDIDLSAIWRVLVERKKLIARITAATTVLAVIYALILPPVYRAEILLMPLSQESAGAGPLSSQYSDLAALAGISLSGNADAQTQRALATLKSRAFTESFMKEAGVLQVLYSSMWDEKSKTWKDTSWFGSDEKPTGPSMENAYRMFNGGIRTVLFDRKTNLTTVTIDWDDPKIAAQWANQLIKHLNARLQGEAVKDAERNIDYLRKQLTTNSSVEIQQAIYNLIEAQLKSIMVASTREEYAFKVIDPATVPERKLKPNRRMIVLVGLFLGLFAGVATAFLQPRVQPTLQPYIDTWRERWRTWRRKKTA